MNLLDDIKQSFDTFSRSERKVAEVILEMPQTVIHSSIASIAQIANVSEPTVNRFCHRMDTKGFPDFKLHLAQNLANNVPFAAQSINALDRADVYKDKVFETAMACLDSAKNSLDAEKIEQAVNLLQQARQIIFCGQGHSAFIAKDAQTRFIQTHSHVSYVDDVISQQNAYRHANEQTVFVLFSDQDHDWQWLNQFINTPHSISIIFINAHHQTLFNGNVLTLDVSIAPDMNNHLSSRLAQMTVIDVLYAGLTK